MRFCPFLLLVVAFCLPMAKGQTVTIYKATGTVQETADKVEAIVRSLGLLYFETVEHDKIAKSRGITIPPVREILFEDPDLTTKLIQCQPTIALDLPMKVIVWQEEGDVYLGFIDPKFLRKVYLLSGCEHLTDEMSKLMLKVVVDTLRASENSGGK
jgi:uncharacterized protein (DUF302 family)